MIFRLLCLLLLLPAMSGCSWWPGSGEEEGQEQVAQPEPPSPEEQREVLTRHLLRKGLVAYETDRLSLPPDDCAVYYYREVLKLEPHNIEAQRGLDKVVSRYLQLAKVAHGNGNDKQARQWLDRAAEVRGGSSKINAVKARLDKTPKGQNNREIAYLPATDYLLSRDDLDERGPEIHQRLEKIARRAEERGKAVLVLGRTEDEASWILRTLRASVPQYALKARTSVASKPAVLLVPENKLAESDRLLQRKFTKEEKAEADRALRQKAGKLKQSGVSQEQIDRAAGLGGQEE